MGEAGDRENKAQVAAQRNLRRALNHVLACFRPGGSNWGTWDGLRLRRKRYTGCNAKGQNG